MDVPVIVVGAGPAGLFLAAELRLGGVDVLVLDELDRPSGQSRGLGFTARTMELFDQRGLLPRFGAVETSALGHFGGLPLDYGVLDDAHFGARGIPQARTEAVLGAWAAELGAEIRRGWRVDRLVNGPDGAEIEAATPTGRRRLRCRYLVGCDGGRSFVRGAAGFDFPGSAATREMFLADVSGCAIRPRQIGERLPGGMVMSAPLTDGVDRVIVCEHGTPPRRRDGPPAFAEVADAWQRLTGEDIRGGTAHWVSSFGDATHQVTEYRRDSVLLAGDAAHTHLPAGGQGLSVSVQDSMNLGWKLAATVRGWAPPDLLDTYHTERHPVGSRLLTNTRAQGLLYLSGEEVQPLREVFAELMELPEAGRHLAGRVSGLDIRYDVGPGDHPLLGRRLPPRELTGEQGATSTAEQLHPGRGVLFDLADDPGPRRAAVPWADRIRVVTAAPREAPGSGPFTGTTALLVRPDGHVVWTAPGGGDLPSALRRWFGPAR
ncbi:FAD-dependent monooxygenase [Streptomyces sp. I05A-00742]|uniref:FAD-dependent monooxygenase n=1 Tax=Streptomyces sp. I05A-00742 TaxID=2732853 RepID=UPI0014877717|nr:FAD-dependent monooxygenase [Streptomyces sp. I05A-00742]